MAMLPLAESVVGAATASRVVNAQAAAANVAAIAQHAAMTRLAIVRSFIADPSSVDWKVSMFDSPPTANRKIWEPGWMLKKLGSAQGIEVVQPSICGFSYYLIFSF
jgi:hypothetical protein